MCVNHRCWPGAPVLAATTHLAAIYKNNRIPDAGLVHLSSCPLYALSIADYKSVIAAGMVDLCSLP